jgi:subtilase-type serine protease
MSYKSLPLICILSILLSSCGFSLQPSVKDATRCSPTVTLSSSASSIYESTSSSINIIATLSCLKSSAENVLVSIGTAGTATEGVDYSVVSDITIIAGNTSGTTTFNPTSDTTHEPSNETAILSITGVSGMGATESGTQSVTITINEFALNSGTTLTYNSTNATALANTAEFKNFRYISGASSQNPLEVINAHKAYGYGLTGAGATIAIMDTGFWTGHQELAGSSKSITSYGTLVAATGVSAGHDHGLFVSSIAAGEDDGTGMQGVAPGASLHLSDFSNKNGATDFPTHWALATDNASSAVVHNNSWALNTNYSALTSYMSSNSVDASTAYSAYWSAAGYDANKTSWNQYITAMNNFQSHGVIVRTLSNSTSELNMDAAIPEQYPELAEAWIAVVNIEITGSSGDETYTRQSAPCGIAGKYCLGADGHQVVGAAFDQDGATDLYWQGPTGTSFVAPQVSGAVALLSEAFPNHSPEQLTDRLLASADNSFFSHDAAVTFGNGVKHGYDDEFGHGVMDIYAALQPITSSAYTQVYIGDTLDSNVPLRLNNSVLSTSSALGDSVSQGLVGEIGYTYDDLDGGFEYDLDSHIAKSNKEAPTINLVSELNKLSSPLNNSFTFKPKYNFNQVVGNYKVNSDLNTSVTIGASSYPVQNFFDSNNDLINLSSYQAPYLEANEGGIGVNASYQLSNSRLLLGATVPMEQSNGQTIGTRKSLVSSLELGDSSNHLITLMAGITEDKDSLLGSKGSSAFSLDGSNSTTTFAALKSQKQFNNNFALTGIATFGNTNMSSPRNSFIDSASDVKSLSVALIANMNNLSKDDSFSLYIGQPSRVENGSMAIKIASLADSNRKINQTIKNINLESSARQVDMGFSYRKDVSEDLTFSLKHLITNNLNHSSLSNRLHSSYVGMDYKDLKLGINSNPNDSSIEKQVSYVIAL